MIKIRFFLYNVTPLTIHCGLSDRCQSFQAYWTTVNDVLLRSESLKCRHFSTWTRATPRKDTDCFFARFSGSRPSIAWKLPTLGAREIWGELWLDQSEVSAPKREFLCADSGDNSASIGLAVGSKNTSSLLGLTGESSPKPGLRTPFMGIHSGKGAGDLLFT